MTLGSDTAPFPLTRDELDTGVRHLRLRLAIFGRRLHFAHDHPDAALPADRIAQIRSMLASATHHLDLAEDSIDSDPAAAGSALALTSAAADRLAAALPIARTSEGLPGVRRPSPDQINLRTLFEPPPNTTPFLDAILWLVTGGPFGRP